MSANPRLMSALIIPFLIALQLYAMPPLDGGIEPSFPPGVNSPTPRGISRDDADIEGEWNCLVILIDFPDYPWDFQDDENFPNEERIYTREHFEDMLFSVDDYRHPGSASEFTGSMRDYYLEISDGVFETVGVVTEWYRAPHELSWYCNPDGEDDTEDDYGFGEYPQNVQGLVEDALELADDDVDFSEFDNDDDRVVDALFVVHAGPGAEAAGQNPNYIWSHKWQLWDPPMFDEVWFDVYSMEPQDGTIGVFCHEFGHVLGLPDLYDTDYSSEGIGEWCLMSGGGWNHRPGDPRGSCPAHMTGWCKIQLDWVEVINVTEFTRNQVIPPVEVDPVVYRLWTNGEDSPEYFLAEHRRRIGFDAGLVRRQVVNDLPEPFGLLITHIDDNMGENADEHDRWVDVEEASPLFIDDEPFENLDHERLEGDIRNLYNPSRGDNGDLWPGFSRHNEDSTDWIGGRDRDEFTYLSIPSSNGKNGNPSLVAITNIRFDEDGNIVCDMNTSPPDEVLIYLDEVAASDEEGGNGDGYIQPGETVMLYIRLGNLGQQESPAIHGVLSSVEEFVDITSEETDWDGIPGGEAMNAEMPFVVDVFPDAPIRADMHFTLLTVDADQDSQSFPFSLELRPSADWFKYSRNPVFGNDDNSWYQNEVYSPTVLVEGELLLCWFVAGGLDLYGGMVSGSIGYAESLDGGMTWRSEYFDHPMVDADDIEWLDGFGGLAVQRQGDIYYMAFSANLGADVFLGIAQSEDGINWVFGEGPILTVDDVWMDGIFSASQLALSPDLSGGTALTFVGYLGVWQMPVLGVAISPDMQEWLVDEDVAFMPSLNMDAFDGFGVMCPDVTLENEEFTVLYTGLAIDSVARLGMLNFDGENIEPYPGLGWGGSVLEPGGEGGWGEQWLFGGRIFTWDNRQRMLFAGVSPEEGSAFGLAFQNPALDVPPATPGQIALPTAILLNPAYPNPFNSSTVVSFALRQKGLVQVGVYDLMGRRVAVLAEGVMERGSHHVVWDGSTIGGGQAAGGYYLMGIKQGGTVAMRGIVLLR